MELWVIPNCAIAHGHTRVHVPALLWELESPGICRSRQSWSLSVEKHRSSCGPECRVSGGPFLRGPASDTLCFLVISRPDPLPPEPAATGGPSLKGLCREFQCPVSFLGRETEVEPELEAEPVANLLLLPLVPWVAVVVAVARDDWCVGLPIMVMANGSSGESRIETALSRSQSRSFWEVEEEPVSALLLLRETENGSPRPSRLKRGRAGAQGSEGGGTSGEVVLSKAVRKGSSGGMCLQLHTGVSRSGGARGQPKAGKPGKAGSDSDRGQRGAWAHAADGSSRAAGGRPGEGSRKAVRKGSGGRTNAAGSLLCVAAGQAAQPVGSGDGPRG